MKVWSRNEILKPYKCSISLPIPSCELEHEIIRLINHFSLKKMIRIKHLRRVV